MKAGAFRLRRMMLRRCVGQLALTSFKDSPAPRRAIAKELEKELCAAGIPKEDHFIVVALMFHE